jgi:hypothetical protein
MAGVKGQKGGGGARPNAGRKSKSDERELKSLLDAAWPLTARASAIERVGQIATAGDVQSFKTLMAYTYGTPPSGDELKLRAALEVELDRIFAIIEKHFGAEAFAEFKRVLLAESRGISASPSE